MNELGNMEPRFRRGDLVQFMGGSGKICNYQFASGIWMYAVEIVGESDEGLSSSMILLSETDLFD
jgi:hypothetical protein